MTSLELKQLFHNPEDMSDAELDIMNLKLRNMSRMPMYGAAFGTLGGALAESVIRRRQPSMLALGIGAAAGYAFGGYSASGISANMLSRKFDWDILFAQERRQVERTMNLAGYNNNHISSNSTNLNKDFDKPY